MMKKLVCFLVFLFTFLLTYSQHYLLYGITAAGGANNAGIIYRYDPVTGKFDTLYSLNGINGKWTYSNLLPAHNGLLYGITAIGGTKDTGVLFSFNPYTNKYSVLLNFGYSGVVWCANGNNLMQSGSGLLYGTREMGGLYDSGTLFSYNISTGKDSTLINFNANLGIFPNRTVVEDTNNGYFYGTTLDGGLYNNGTLFRYDPVSGKDTVIINFDTAGANIGMPKGNSLMLANNGLFYGETDYGGNWYSISNPGMGTIYSFNPNTNKDTLLYRFTDPTGIGPAWSNLMQAKNDLLYGVTFSYGLYGNGTLFSYDILTNNFKVLVNFSGINGNEPTGDLLQDPENGILYGITVQGGIFNKGVLYNYNIATGRDSVLINFNGANGAYPEREPTLVLDTGGLGTEGIKEVKEEVKVYPNPAHNSITLILNEAPCNNATIGITDLTGRVISSSLVNYSSNKEFTLNISGLAAGVYFVKASSGQAVYNAKFIKE